MTATKRRWFRFSLLTLFVLVTSSAFLTAGVLWARGWAAKREAFINSIHCAASASTEDAAPLPLRLIGAPGYVLLKVGFLGTYDEPLTVKQQQALDRVRRLFPEAIVDGYVFTEPGGLAVRFPEDRRELERGPLPVDE